MDQVHDRGVFRTLADINHLGRVLVAGEPGDAGACGRRILRSVFRPKEWQPQFERILKIESAFGWESTFFFLEGHHWSRYGSRYRLEDQRIQSLASMVLEAGCEIGVHGGYYDLDDAAAYRRSADRIEAAFGVRPVGIRNHFLRAVFPGTWKAQAQAGFLYDATFGWNDRVGPRDNRWLPFRPLDPATGEPLGITVLPLLVMDTTLFRYLRLSGQEALDRVDELLQQAVASGGLASLLWHNNYFAEPEYAEWEEVYAEALRRAAAYGPYCATGADIASWWIAQHGESGGHSSHRMAPWVPDGPRATNTTKG